MLVYFLRDELLTVGGRTVVAATPEAAVTALLDGPTADEMAAGAVSIVPAGTRLLGVELDGDEAVVDLSAPFAEGGGSLSLIARVTQVVFTVTQFPGIDTVRFRIDGEPVVDLGGEGLYVDGLTRDTYDWLVPYVLLERPVQASSVRRPLRLLGRVGASGPALTVEVRDARGDLVYTTGVPSPGSETSWGVLDVVLTDLPSTVSGTHVIRVLDPLADPGDPRSRPAEVVVTL